MSLVSNNDKRIQAAFTRLQTRKDTVIPAGLESLLTGAVALALDTHDESHQRHIESGDNYGWLILHDGVEVKRYVKAGKDHTGEANLALDQVAAKVKKPGWIGVVMAGMHPTDYYSISYEIDVLEYVMSLTLDMFDRHFKKFAI